MDKIWERFHLNDLSAEENQKWKLIDDEILNCELKELMRGAQDTEVKELYSRPDTAEKPWKTVEAEFMQMAASLCCLKNAPHGIARDRASGLRPAPHQSGAAPPALHPKP